jgi:MYXO-CTERM domain-containing protein
VPRAIPVDACGTDRYVASNFTSDHAFWDIVSTSSLRPGDSLASSSHVFMVVGGRDGSGDYDIIEARGCSYGIVHRRRSASGYTGARRINITECNCDEGASEDRDCGDCGTQRRRCADGCSWSSWSECEGSDPGASCTVEGASGVCAEGTSLCVAGWLTCSPPSASADVCDGRDNDCDGVVDNGTPETLGEGFPCTNDCGDGVSRCLDGAVTCVNPGPDGTDEICDGEDTGPPDTGPPDDASPDTGPPDDASPDVGPADAGGPDDGGGSGLALGGVRGGCSCRTPGGSSAEPFAPALALAALLGL